MYNGEDHNAKKTTPGQEEFHSSTHADASFQTSKTNCQRLKK